MNGIRATQAFFCLGFLFFSVLITADHRKPCKELYGVNDGTPVIDPAAVHVLFYGPAAPVWGSGWLTPWIALGIKSLETPLQYRTEVVKNAAMYNALSPFQNKALNIFGEDERFCIDKLDKYTLDLYQRVTATLTLAWVGSNIYPQKEIFGTLTTGFDVSIGLPLKNAWTLTIDPKFNPEKCKEDKLAPWTIARCKGDESIAFFDRTDGFNALGILTSEYNRQPYSDFNYTDRNGNQWRAYRPRNSEDGATPTNSHWAPLRESDGDGFFKQADHVTAYAGVTGRVSGRRQTEKCAFLKSRKTAAPAYDYDAELDFVLEETRKAADDDRAFLSVEIYDNKADSLAFQAAKWCSRNKCTDWEFWRLFVVLGASLNNGVVVTWREKLRQSVIRPPTVSKVLGGTGKKAVTYAGPFVLGSREISVSDWKPVIRTMPHAEHPSGSACLCRVFEEVMQAFNKKGDVVDPPGAVDLQIQKGGSRVSPRLRPEKELLFQYKKFSEVTEECKISRVIGGMHFPQSLDAGEDLCAGLGTEIAEKVKRLEEGDPDARIEARDDDAIVVCPLEEVLPSVFFNELLLPDWVEVAGPAGTNLQGWTIEIFSFDQNAGWKPNGSLLESLSLSGTIPAAPGGSGLGVTSFDLPGVSGDISGVALIDSEGVVRHLAQVGLPANTYLTPKEGVARGRVAWRTDAGEALGSEPRSLQLFGSGSLQVDFKWVEAEPSRDTENSGQSFEEVVETPIRKVPEDDAPFSPQRGDGQTGQFFFLEGVDPALLGEIAIGQTPPLPVKVKGGDGGPRGPTEKLLEDTKLFQEFLVYGKQPQIANERAPFWTLPEKTPIAKAADTLNGFYVPPGSGGFSENSKGVLSGSEGGNKNDVDGFGLHSFPPLNGELDADLGDALSKILEGLPHG
uniref:Uncharacterized protein n=1 Tax=Chromera velia CCMP2878 TaxID=1169474 RepID=A0A0G4IG90_9ALVE|eukprot:Cvel_14179.t1-p1 / transcript=Cvel_14179.t1 / gene=Cvel_14179 / organism=Chromera_velia_CCMP2878 / gene_product=hypothetical protein / transcript_product=hypothetical protein / location=Cvel_scaffold999:53547-58074(-) / protein_length=902 / sequence_SO=supercontig / SO=protein_coding / is_pseudo=false